jgi:Hyaluronidase protein (HylP)
MNTAFARRRLLALVSGVSLGLLNPAVSRAATDNPSQPILPVFSSTPPIAVDVASGVALSALSISTTPGDHVAVLNLAADGGPNNAALNVVSANTAFSAAEVSGHETAHGTLKISHVNPGSTPHSDVNAAALSIDLQAGKAGGTAAQGVFLKSTTGGTSGKIINYVDSTGVTLFALLPDGSLLLRALDTPPAGTTAGLKLCNVSGTLGLVDASGAFTPLS